MKSNYSHKVFNILLLVLFATYYLYSQQNPIPNHSFENWAGGDPVGWQTSNSINQNSVTQSSNSQEGSFSVKLDRVGVTSFGKCGEDLYSMMVDADAFITTGFAISEKYTSLKFYARVNLETSQSCVGWGVVVRLFNSQNQIAAGGNGEEIVSASSDWSEWEAEIFYQQQIIPDSIEIIVAFNDTTANSTSHVLIDNLRLVEKLKITRPTSGMKWLAGGVDSIMWIGGESMNFVRLEFSQDEGSTFDFIDVVDADLGTYVWDIPEAALTTKGLIRIFDIVDTLNADTSDVLKVKGYQLTKLDGNGDYISYDIMTDRWGFGNNQNDCWPFTWWQRFDYRGIDPFTGSQYSQWQGNFIFALAYPIEFPNWEAFVNAFSINACYISTNLAIYSPSALSRWDAVSTLTWKGTCFGIAGANALAYSHTFDFVTEFPYFPAFTDPITVMSDTNVIPVITQLFTHQYGNPSKQNDINKKNITPNETLNEIKSMLFEDEVAVKTISIFNNNGKGGHTILPYELTQDDIDKQYYYLSVYDNSHPNNTTALILFDTTGNSNNGSWLTTYAWQNWGGDKKIYLELNASNYLNNAILPKRNNDFVSPFIMSGDELEVYTNIDANTKILDNLGNITGYINDLIFEEIPNSVSFAIKNGSETPPYGYYLPTDEYSIQISDVQSDTVETFFFTGDKTFTYERTGANSADTDRLFFDNGVSAVNPDQSDRSITLVNIINESTQEKFYALRSLSLTHDDSVKVENVNNDQLKLTSYGTAKNYEIELNYAAETGLGRFGHSGIQLNVNTTHIYLPEWNNITNSQLTVLVDNGNDGTIDDTLYLNNTVAVEDQDNSYFPKEYKLEQNYPNPFNPVTTIKYSIPKAGLITIKVYNVIGEEIAVLVNEEVQSGNFEVKFNANALPSGIYLYRIQAGEFVQTKKMILLK